MTTLLSPRENHVVHIHSLPDQIVWRIMRMVDFTSRLNASHNNNNYYYYYTHTQAYVRSTGVQVMARPGPRRKPVV